MTASSSKHDRPVEPNCDGAEISSFLLVTVRCILVALLLFVFVHRTGHQQEVVETPT